MEASVRALLMWVGLQTEWIGREKMVAGSSPKASPMEDLFWAAHLTLATLILPRKLILFCGGAVGGRHRNPLGFVPG